MVLQGEESFTTMHDKCWFHRGISVMDRKIRWREMNRLSYVRQRPSVLWGAREGRLVQYNVCTLVVCKANSHSPSWCFNLSITLSHMNIVTSWTQKGGKWKRSPLPWGGCEGRKTVCVSVWVVVMETFLHLFWCRSHSEISIPSKAKNMEFNNGHIHSAVVMIRPCQPRPLWSCNVYNARSYMELWIFIKPLYEYFSKNSSCF